MNWDALRFDWTQLRAFLATAEEGSLSGAARALGLTQPTLGRQVSALEGSLSVVLFERVGRGLELTPAGRELLTHARTMGEAAERVALTAAGQAQAIEGRVRITSSDVFSAYILPPVLAQLRKAAPRLEIEVVAANDIRDILRREADIAIRHVRPTEPDLIARLVREDSAGLYAAPSYLAARGRPSQLSDLRLHDFIGTEDTQRTVAYMRDYGLPISETNYRLGSENGVVTWAMARQGLGIIMMADEVAALSPGMERVLPDIPPLVFPSWLVTHRELQSSARIRLVFDMLAEGLAQRG